MTQDTPFEYVVVGEHRDDPARLLLLGSDGLYYSLSLDDSGVTPITPATPSDDWVFDAADALGKLQELAIY